MAKTLVATAMTEASRPAYAGSSYGIVAFREPILLFTSGNALGDQTSATAFAASAARSRPLNCVQSPG